MLRLRFGPFVLFFLIFFIVIFVDLRFLSFYPLTVRDPASTRQAAIVALLGGIAAGLYAGSRKA